MRQAAKVSAADAISGTERRMHVQGRRDSPSHADEEPLDKQTTGAGAEVLDQTQSANVLITDGHQPAGRERLPSKGNTLHSNLPQWKLLASRRVKVPANQIFLPRLNKAKLLICLCLPPVHPIPHVGMSGMFTIFHSS